MTRRLFAGSMFLFCAAQAVAQSPATDDPESWYRNDYAPLWRAEPVANLDRMLAAYAPQIDVHDDDGAPARLASDEWLGGALAQWADEGWNASELTGLRVDRINEGTVAFKARWEDHYDSGLREVSCGWYLADRVDGRWTFTAYAEIDCATHGL